MLMLLMQQQESGQPGSALGDGTLAACKTLFAQLPWEAMHQLPEDVIRTHVLPQLIDFLHDLAPQAAAGDPDAVDLMQSTITVCDTISAPLAVLQVLQS